MLDVIGQEIPGYRKPEQAYDWPNAQEEVEAIATGTFGVKLPAGWNKPPVHRTEYNCWRCGVFAANTRITKRDEADGWVQTWNGKRVADVRCPKCASSHGPNGKAPEPPFRYGPEWRLK